MAMMEFVWWGINGYRNRLLKDYGVYNSSMIPIVEWLENEGSNKSIGVLVEAYVTDFESQTKESRNILAREALIRLGGKVIPVVIDALMLDYKHNRGNPEEQLESLLYRLGLTEKEMVSVYIKGLKNKNVNVRRRSVKRLGELKDGRAFDPLIKLLTDEDIIIAKSVPITLGKLGDVRAVDPLIKLLGNKIYDSDMLEVVTMLGGFKSERAIEALYKFSLGFNDINRERNPFEFLADPKIDQMNPRIETSLNQLGVTRDEIISKYSEAFREGLVLSSFVIEFSSRNLQDSRSVELIKLFDKLKVLIPESTKFQKELSDDVHRKALDFFAKALELKLSGFDFNIKHIAEDGHFEHLDATGSQDYPFPPMPDYGSSVEPEWIETMPAHDIWIVDIPEEIIIVQGKKISDK